MNDASETDGAVPDMVSGDAPIPSDTATDPDAGIPTDAGPAEPYLVDTTLGPVRGFDEGEGDFAGQVRSFLGIPYAEPPVGTRRWTAPLPHPGWEDELMATAFGRACTQDNRLLNPEDDRGEDCLTLNVWRPDAEREGGYPVLVYIHGGRFNWGTSSLRPYHGARIASAGLVVVTINYRVGLYGFFSHPDIAGRSGNFGFMDQVEALRWVQQNAEAFGGDPSRVTIAGSSAGGASVGQLVASPEVEADLFHGAIIISGGGAGANSRPHISDPRGSALPTGHQRASRLVDELAALAPVRSRHACLMEASRTTRCEHEVLMSAEVDEISSTALARENSSTQFRDDFLVPRHYLNTFEMGLEKRIPLLTGSVGWEASVTESVETNPASRDFLAPFSAARFGADNCVAELQALHSGLSDELTAHRVWGDWRFLMPARRAAELHTANGHRSHHYWFNYAADFRPRVQTAHRLGAPHPILIPFAFQNIIHHPTLSEVYYGPDGAPSDQDRLVSDSWRDLFVSFVNGDERPTTLGGAVSWPAYGPEASTLVTDRAGTMSLMPRFFQRRYQFYVTHTFPRFVGCP